MGSSYICVGNNSANPPAAGNTCTTIPFFDGGFITVSLPHGRYVYIFRIGGIIGSPDQNYNISQVRLYGLPNLVATATAITTYSPVSAIYGHINLTTNLNIRSARWGWKPLINAAGTSATFSSCFRVLKSSITGL